MLSRTSVAPNDNPVHRYSITPSGFLIFSRTACLRKYETCLSAAGKRFGVGQPK